MDREVYEGLLLAVVAASVRKAKAGLSYAASRNHQDYPPGILELGVVLDAIDMIQDAILRFVVVNAEHWEVYEDSLKALSDRMEKK